MKELAKHKVVLGLSGGVDSTTAALLLKEKGYQVIGFYFDVSGTNHEGVEAARKTSEQLGIDFVHRDVSKAFKSIVVDNFCSEYIKGRTPNPCIICNPNVKFKQLIEVADQVGAYYIATGHYAQIYTDDCGISYIQRAANEKKDQSYMLYRLGQDVTSRLMFPLHSIEDKEKTRDIARKYNLSNADTSDSQEICFIDDEKENYKEYILNHGYKCKEGNFIDYQGKVLGTHSGLLNYTIGQRKGLGITFGKPVFVTNMNYKNNTVTLGENTDLFKKDIISSDNIFAATSSGEFPYSQDETIKVMAKIRYAAKPGAATIKVMEDGRIFTHFEDGQRAATPGQSIVFYIDDHVIGGGFIDEIK